MTVSRSLGYLAGIALTMAIAFACSSDPAQLSTGFGGPALFCIEGISLSTGNVPDSDTCDAVGTGDGPVPGSSVLACDHKIAIALSVINWDLRQPGACAVTQCGRVRIQLSDSTHDKPLISQEYASAGISLDLGSFFPVDGDPQLAAGTYTLTAELVDDASNPYNPVDGGKGSAQVSFQLDLPTNCGATDGSAGAGGTGSVSDGGAAGLAGSAGASDSAGAAGQSAGASDSAGAAGQSTGGTGGTGGTSPDAGAAGE